MSWSERIRGSDSYGVLLLLIGASLIAAAVSGRSVFTRSIVLVLQGTVLLYAIWTTRSGRRLFRWAIIVVPATVVLAVALTPTESEAVAGAVALSSAALALLAIGSIVRRLVTHPRIDAATILGVVCTYLLIGTFFAFVYAAVGAFSDQAFFVTQTDPISVDFLYFSFVTMTTVGYGDFIAATNLGRMLAVTQALLGQLYLVTVVALVIGNIGRERRGP
jgi:hypothetical protein